MTDKSPPDIETFRFRNLHPHLSLGTASDRYAGWIGQIYSEERYSRKISRRSKTVGGKSFKEEVLPVASVEEYFQHFSVLELDFTFYRLLFDDKLEPTPNYHVLRQYKKHLGEQDQLIVKVPQTIFAQRLWQKGRFIVNPDYLNPELFIRRFYEPAAELLGGLIRGFIFEQEYQAKKNRIEPARNIEMLDRFFGAIPQDDRYHIELRTASFLTPPYFTFLAKYGLGQVLSHWTWLPPLRDQFTKSNHRFPNARGHCIIRLMTPLGMRYAEAYDRAHPFNRMIEGMMNPQMVAETVELIRTAIQQGIHTNVIINNRAGGNAPLIARKISHRFMESEGSGF